MYIEQTVVRGDNGEHVTRLQEWLLQLGHYAGTIDGEFGEATETAVQRFQEALGLPRDGQVQAETWQALELHAGYHDGGGPEAQERQLSEDGNWWWDGADWQPVEAAAVVTAASLQFASGHLSEDGLWQWDGQNWLAAPADANQGAKPKPKDKEVNGVKLKRGVCNHPDEASEVLSGVEVAQLAKDAGFKGEALVKAVAIAKAESGWDRTCYSFTDDVGLWQINKVNWPTFGGKDKLYEAATNAQAAFKLSGGKDFSPWSAFKNGSFAQFVAEARAAVAKVK